MILILPEMPYQLIHYLVKDLLFLVVIPRSTAMVFV